MKNFTYKYELVVRIIAVLFVAFFAFVFLTGSDFDLIPMIIVSTVLTAVEAVAIYAFSPQVSLDIYNEFHEVKYLDRYHLDTNISKYLNLHNLIQNYNGKLYYFYPYRCIEDIAQYNEISDRPIQKFFAFIGPQ